MSAAQASGADEAEAVDDRVIVVVAASADNELVTILESRGRPVRVAATASDLPTDVGDVRALAVLPDAESAVVDAASSLLGMCHDAEVPVLGVGAAAGVVAGLIGATYHDVDVETVRAVALTEAAEEDPMMAPTPSGVEWVVHGVLEAADDATTLAEADGDPVVLVSGGTYAVSLQAAVDLATVDALIEHEVVSAAARPFLLAHSAALLGRWVDLVVGRTDAEMPWGRRGPQPVAAPGLSLNPA